MYFSFVSCSFSKSISDPNVLKRGFLWACSINNVDIFHIMLPITGYYEGAMSAASTKGAESIIKEILKVRIAFDFR